MTRRIFGVLLALAASLPLHAMACNIVYGDNWAFVSSPPDGWTAACGKEAMDETALTLWPSDQAPGNAHALIYVTVSGKGDDTLSSFVEDEIARFKQDAPEPQSMAIGATQDISPSRKIVHLGNATGGRDELIEYIEGPTAFYIAVLTTESPSAGQRYKPAFDSFLDSFSPASLKQGGN